MGAGAGAAGEEVEAGELEVEEVREGCFFGFGSD